MNLKTSLKIVSLTIIFISFIGLGVFYFNTFVQKPSSTSTEITDINKIDLAVKFEDTKEYKKRKELYSEIKWSESCEKDYDSAQNNAAEVTFYNLSENKYLVEVPCGMTNQGPKMSYIYYDKNPLTHKIKQLSLIRYIKSEDGKYQALQTETIKTLTTSFTQQKTLSINFRSTVESLSCYYSYLYIFNSDTKELELQSQTHSRACETGSSDSDNSEVIDFPVRSI